jgi:hypothetical protein
LNKKLIIFQIVAEALIPLLGYFFWDWNFYFIALFYFLDLTINTFFLPVKAKKFKEYSNFKSKVNLYFIAALVSLFLIFVVGVLMTQFLIPKFNLVQQTLDFMLLQDVGIPIPQGVILLPLLIYGAYMQYKMEFLTTKKHERIKLENLLKLHVYSLIATILLLAIGCIIVYFINLPEIIAIITLIILTSLYSFRCRKN